MKPVNLEDRNLEDRQIDVAGNRSRESKLHKETNRRISNKEPQKAEGSLADTDLDGSYDIEAATWR